MNKSNLKIVFFGTPKFAIPVLKEILDNEYSVSGVFAGHGPVGVEARKHSIKVYNPKSLKKDDQIFEEFKYLKPDLCIVAAYGKILPSRYLDIPQYGFLNVHPSILPKYRGPSPVQTAILNGDKETGASIMMIDKEVDHGPVLASTPYKISDTKYNIEIAEDIFKLGGQLLIEILPKYINKEIEPKEQDHSQATFTKMFQREDGRINWSEPAEKIYNQTRALNPEPGTWTSWKGKVINIPAITMFNIVSPTEFLGRLKHGQETTPSQVVDLVAKTPGAVGKIGNDIAIGTGTGYLTFKSIQLEGGKEMDAKSFVNGHPDFLNSTLE